MAYPDLNSAPVSSSRSSLNIMGANDGLLTPRSVHSEETDHLLSAGGDIERGRVDQSSYGSTSSSPEEGTKSRRSSKVKRRVQYYIPSIAWIPNYSFSLLGGDILAGFTVASMLIPQSVSYASSLARLNPVTGLFSASIPGIIYAFLGTSRQLNVAPEAALSLLLGQAVSDIHHDMDDRDKGFPDSLGLSVATVITLQVGFISFLLGFFRLGFIDVVLSRALLRGFIAAVAVVIMIEQLIPMFGLVALEHQIQPESTFDKLLFLIEHIWDHSHWETTIISFSALAILILARSFKQVFKKYWWIYRVPEVLVVVVVSTLLSDEFGWDQAGVDILGDVPVKTGEGFFFQSPFKHSNLRFLKRTTSTAVVISVIGFLDSIVAAKGAAAKFGYTVSPNRELVALGAANLAASFVPGTLPAYGSITRTRINGDVGARTQMASLVCSGVILLATFFLLPWLYYLPKCVLASIILLVVFSLIAETPHDVHYYWKMRSWIDLTLMTLTFVFSIIWNVEVGIVVSLIISLLLVVHRSSKARMTILGRIPGTDRWKPINENPEAEEDVQGAVIVRLKENLDFANTAQLKERLRRLELYGVRKSHPSDRPSRKEATSIVFHMADVDSCDAIAAQIILELAEEYRNRGVGLIFTHVQPPLRDTFEKAGIVKLLGVDAFKENVADAMSARAR
ncbi:endoplasmic reticulum protein [Moniliophthora roreri MCA 2997]|uniref:Endoplasmic reticulum protein n=2 Tax=Moniliophthora roreri TaxID=221103 RepID=V2XXJ3_MONRO|nr:endoplasmic reticulum protein [Moniliophthora roreri MCA 2997]KAI3611972.1 endoplasmic reticulum protein [Moniliophthora roreri]